MVCWKTGPCAASCPLHGVLPLGAPGPWVPVEGGPQQQPSDVPTRSAWDRQRERLGPFPWGRAAEPRGQGQAAEEVWAERGVQVRPLYEDLLAMSPLPSWGIVAPRSPRPARSPPVPVQGSGSGEVVRGPRAQGRPVGQGGRRS